MRVIGWLKPNGVMKVKVSLAKLICDPGAFRGFGAA